MKLTRYNGHVPLFSQDMEGRERTLFGSTVQDDDINNQFTPEFLRGWGSVGSTEFPTLQDFNALAYTHNKLLSYLYQAGIPSYTQNEEYYIGSIVQYNKDIYICLRDNPNVLPTDTNAWKRLQESLTFVGDGPEVMKKGAFGLGGSISATGIVNYTNTSYINNQFFSETDPNKIPAEWNSVEVGGWVVNRSARPIAFFFGNRAELKMSYAGQSGWQTPHSFHTTANTRTDKNNVLHAGTTTPINTLNVSDMSQEVINNDLLTVTSGAVYRALQPKADSIYVNTELNKKANLTYVNSELLKKADLTYVNTELDKKITGGNVVQTTGQSAVDVMSQKRSTDLLTPLLNNPVDVTTLRQSGITYTNNTDNPRFVLCDVVAKDYAEKVTFLCNGVIVSQPTIATAATYSYSVFFVVPPLGTYSFEANGGWVHRFLEYN